MASRVWMCLVVIILAVAVSAVNLAAQTDRGVPTMPMHVAGQLPEGLDLHGSAVVGSRLYIFGGKKAGAWNNQAWSAELRSNGSLGQWRDEATLPQFATHIGSLVEVFNDRIYIMGGLRVASADITEKTITTAKEVLWTRVGADGKLEEWKQSEPLEKPLAHGASCATLTNVYQVGGKYMGAVTNIITVADLVQDGAPVRWREAGTLPVPLCFHGAAIMEGRMIVWGGLLGESTTEVNPNIYSATVGKDGSLGPWETIGTMPTPLYRAGFLGFNDYLVCVGGLAAGGASTNTVWHTALSGGKLVGWQVVGTDLAASMYVSVTVDRERGWAITSGGRHGASDKSGAINVVTAVQLFRVPQAEERRLVVSQQPSASAAATGPGSFLKMADALKAASAQNKRILVLFYSPEVPSCKRLWSEVIASSDFQKATQGLILAAVDVTSADVSYSYKYGAFRVPSFVLVAPDGAAVRSAIGARTMEDVTPLLGK